LEKAYIKSPLGTVEICGSEAGISAVSLLDEEIPASETLPSVLTECARQLEAYFEGSRKEFSVPLDPKGTEFQRQVWEELSRISFGTTVSYSAIARKLGDVKKIRAVGMANGKNPLAIIVPCHRVIGADGALVGYAGGLWRKKWLLEHEGVRTGSAQTRLFE
jgi:methylated-DNA-[protein]-cysteine S-methyltransferase